MKKTVTDARQAFGRAVMMEMSGNQCHMPLMNDNDTYPYKLEVQPSQRKPGMFEWTIRKNGKLAQRADRMHRSEEEARRDGLKAVERQFSDAQGSR